MSSKSRKSVPGASTSATKDSRQNDSDASEYNTPPPSRSALGKRGRRHTSSQIEESPKPSKHGAESASDTSPPTKGGEASRGRATSSLPDVDDLTKPDSPEPETAPVARRRHTSSLISDHSDSKPTASRPAAAKAKAIKESATRFTESLEPPRQRRKMAESTEKPTNRNIDPTLRGPSAPPAAGTTLGFSITGPPADAIPFPEPDPDGAQSFKSNLTKRRSKTAAPGASSPNAMEDVQANGEVDGGVPADNERSEFSFVFSRLVKSHEEQSAIIDEMHGSHEKSMKLTQNLASRRKQRIAQLDRENDALRRQLTTGTTTTTTSQDYERKLATSTNTISMLTADLKKWEDKYNTSQASLRSTTDDAQTFERKYNASNAANTQLKEQMARVNEELKGKKEQLKGGFRQVSALHKLMVSTDRKIVKKVRELARLSGEWDEAGGANGGIRVKVSQAMEELVGAWDRFEGEYEEGVAGEGVEV